MFFFNWFYCNLSITCFRKPIKSRTYFAPISFIKLTPFGEECITGDTNQILSIFAKFWLYFIFLIKEPYDISFVPKNNFLAKILKISTERVKVSNMPNFNKFRAINFGTCLGQAGGWIFNQNTFRHQNRDRHVWNIKCAKFQ